MACALKNYSSRYSSCTTTVGVLVKEYMASFMLIISGRSCGIVMNLNRKFDPLVLKQITDGFKLLVHLTCT